jgi:SAM-dependent methyltransferase
VNELLRVESVPVFQNRIYDSRIEARLCPKGDVVLVQDPRTGLVHNAAFDGAALVYDETYQNEQAVSPSFVRHLDAVLELAGRHFRGKSVVEIGCGKGYFLERLLSAGYAASGVDPAYEGRNPHIVKARYGEAPGMKAECVVLRHVLEHIERPLEFLAGVARANGGNGVVYIEVPCLDWICERRAWFDVFYEHVNYFRLSDLRAMFGTVHEAGRLFGGQYLYVFAELGTLREPNPGAGGEARFPPDFLAGVMRFAAMAAEATDRGTAIWGAGAKGVMFAYHLMRLGAECERVIDVNPAKQGKFIAGSGARVSAPEEAAAELSADGLVFVMNSNYLAEVASQVGKGVQLWAVDGLGAGAKK